MGKQRYKAAKKITIISMIVNASIGFVKLIGGILFHSHGLVADAFHSFSDLVTDLMVIIASRFGSQGADPEHPYGHQRVETAATFILSVLLILTGIGIVWDSFDQLIDKHYAIPTLLAIPVALLSIAANEALFYYTLRVGKKINSPLIITNAWHHRSDAASSFVVLIGLIGSMAGYHYLDSIAAIIVALMIVKMGFRYCWKSIKELIDTGLDIALIADIESTIKAIDGIEKVHQLRSRMMGHEGYIDVHIQVAPKISVSEGHYIAQNVHFTLIKKFPVIKDVTVHVDPEDDEYSAPCLELPTRHTLEKTLLKPWQKKHPGIDDWRLHYLDGKLHIELQCVQGLSEDDALQVTIEKSIQEHPYVKTVTAVVVRALK